MKDRDLRWYSEANRPNRKTCNRNGCIELATTTVRWQRYSSGYRACARHAAWWGHQTGPVVVTRR